MKRSREEVFVSPVPTHLRDPRGTSSIELQNTLTDTSWSSWTGFHLASEQIDNVFFADEGITAMVDSKIVSLPCKIGVADKDEYFLEECGFIDVVGTYKNGSLIDKFVTNDASVTIGNNDDKKETTPPFSHNVTVDATYKHQSTSSSAILTFPQERGIELSLALEGLSGITTVLERSLPVTLLQDQE